MLHLELGPRSLAVGPVLSLRTIHGDGLNFQISSQKVGVPWGIQ